MINGICPLFAKCLHIDGSIITCQGFASHAKGLSRTDGDLIKCSRVWTYPYLFRYLINSSALTILMTWFVPKRNDRRSLHATKVPAILVEGLTRWCRSFLGSHSLSSSFIGLLASSWHDWPIGFYPPTPNPLDHDDETVSRRDVEFSGCTSKDFALALREWKKKLWRKESRNVL